MSRTELDTLLAQIRAIREQTLVETAGLTEADFTLPTACLAGMICAGCCCASPITCAEHASQAQAARVAGRSCADAARTDAGRGRDWPGACCSASPSG